MQHPNRRGLEAAKSVVSTGSWLGIQMEPLSVTTDVILGGRGWLITLLSSLVQWSKGSGKE